MSKLVLIWPSPWDNRLGNGIFETGFSLRGAFKRAYSLWREQAAAAGYDLHTWDMAPIENAHVLWFINLPRTRQEYVSVRKKNPHARTVLQINESPLLAPLMFHPKNSQQFDCLVTYCREDATGANRWHYQIPLTLESIAGGMPFHARKHVCIINSNRVEGWFAMRQPGMCGLPGIGVALSGWHYKLSDLWINCSHGLYQARRGLCRSAERVPGLSFDIYGHGWNGEQISWCPGYPRRKYPLLVNSRVKDKLQTAAQYRFNIAFENYRGNHGYVDIKIFDSILAGSVPVYLGDENISRLVPPEVFVDARRFSSHQEMLVYLRDCPEAEWSRMQQAGQEFLRSDQFKPFTDEGFAERMTEVLRKIAP